MASASLPTDSLNSTVSHEELLRFMRTSFNDVFTLNQDRTEFFMPSTMRGVPVDTISDDSPYREPNWASVTDFLSEEAHEEREKLKYRELENGQPGNKAISKKWKFHQDNVSKYRKVREIFGPGSNYHPNQLVAKCHLPPGGLCEKEIMYRLACKISELRTLQEKNYLAMDPWDFYRWRIAVKVQEHLVHPGARACGFIKSAISRLCDLDERHNRNSYADPLMRGAVMLAADLQNRPNLYKKAKNGRRPSVPNIPRGPMTSTTTRKKRGRSMGPTPNEVREAERRERREKIAAARLQVNSVYAGVNAYRANKGSQNQGK